VSQLIPKHQGQIRTHLFTLTSSTMPSPALRAGFVAAAAVSFAPSSFVGAARTLSFFATSSAPVCAPVPRRARWTMMPIGVPKVLFRVPGGQQADWVDIYNRLYRERIIFLGQEIDDEIANQIIAVMLYLESEDNTKPIYLYINSPGGSVVAGMAIYGAYLAYPCDSSFRITPSVASEHCSADRRMSLSVFILLPVLSFLAQTP
jgi:Clp protease